MLDELISKQWETFRDMDMSYSLHMVSTKIVSRTPQIHAIIAHQFEM